VSESTQTAYNTSDLNLALKGTNMFILGNLFQGG